MLNLSTLIARLTAKGGVALAAGAVAVSGGAVAAASAGVLPGPIQHIAGSLFGAAPPTVDTLLPVPDSTTENNSDEPPPTGDSPARPDIAELPEIGGDETAKDPPKKAEEADKLRQDKADTAAQPDKADKDEAQPGEQAPKDKAEPVPTRAREFQGLYGPLPTGCTGPGYACAYRDATGPVSGGVSDLEVRAESSSAVSVRWRPGTGRGWPEPVGFVLLVYADGAKVHESRIPKASTSAVARGLPSGRNVTVHLHELNSEGLSPAQSRTVFIPTAPPPASGSPSPTPSPGP